MTKNEIRAHIAIDGEAEVKQQLANIRSNMSLLGSELVAVSAKFDGQKNSYEALVSHGVILEKQLEAQKEKYNALSSALSEAEKIKAKYIKDLSEEREKLDSIKDSDKNAEKAKEEHIKKIKDLEAVLAAATAQTQDYQKKVNYASAAVADASKAVEQNSKYVKEAEKDYRGIASSIDSAGKAADKFSSVELVANYAIIGKVGDSLKQLTEALSDLANEYNNAASNIAKATGAMGAELDGLRDIASNVFASVPESIDSVSQVLGTLSTATGLTGQELEDLTKLTMDYARVNNEDAGRAATSLGRLMNALNADASELGGIMDKLTLSAQMSGIGVNQLTDYIIQAGPSFEEMGFGIEKSIALFSQYYKAGANPAEITSTLNKALTTLAREGATDAEGAFNILIGSIKDAPGIMEATVIAADAFGARVSSKIAEDIRAGRFEVDEWVNALQGAHGTIAQTADTAKTLDEKWQEASNSIKKAFMQNIAPSVEASSESLADMALKLGEILKENEWLVASLTALGAVLGTAAAACIGYTIAVKGLALAKTTIIPAIKAFNVALAANPVGAVVMGVAALTAGIVALGLAMGDNETETQRLSREWRELRDAADEARQAYEDAVEAISRNTINVRANVSELQTLASNTNRTAAETEMLIGLVGELNKSVPGLNLEYNELNDTLNLTAERILAIADAEAERELRQANRDELIRLREEKDRLEKSILIAEAAVDEAWARQYESQAQRGNNIRIATESLEMLRLELSATEAAFETLTNTINYAAMTTEEKLAEAQRSFEAYKDSAERAGNALDPAIVKEYEDEIRRLTLSVEAKASAAENAAEVLEDLADAYGSATDAARELDSDIKMLTGAMSEQAGTGELSLDTILRLTDAGYGAALSYDTVTGAYYLNEDACRSLMQAKIDEHRTTLEAARREAITSALEAERGAAVAAAAGYVDLMNARVADAAAARAQAQGLDAIIKAMENAPKYSYTPSSGGGGSSRGSVSPSKAPAREADPARELKRQYDEEREITDYHYKMGETSAGDYYEALSGLRDRYFEENTPEWRKATLELHNMQNSLEEARLKEQQAIIDAQMRALKEEHAEKRDILDYHYQLGELSAEVYYAALAQLRDEYLEEDTSEWRKATLELHRLQEQTAQQEKAAIKQKYDDERDIIEFYYQTGRMSAEEYFSELARLRGEYLEEGSADWRRATVELYSRANDLFKEQLAERKAQIQQEIDLEKERLNAIIGSINEEIAARRNLRADEDSEDKIKQAEQRVADAERTLAAARAKAEFARDDAERIEAEKLVMQKEADLAAAAAALDKARQDADDQIWYREKQAEIEEIKGQIQEAELEAKARAEESEADVNRRIEEIRAGLAPPAGIGGGDGTYKLHELGGSIEAAMCAVAEAAKEAARQNQMRQQEAKEISKSAVVNVTYTTAAPTSSQLAAAVLKVVNGM